MANEIVIKDLSKNFADVQAVNGLNFEIRKGELFGLLKPIGAGKTTTIWMLSGLLAPSGRTALYGDLDIRGGDLPQIKSRIGVCPQEAAVFKFLIGKENIELMGNLHGLKKRTIREGTTKLLTQADFTDAVRRKAKGYSGGMMRQLNLLMALISDPDIVFLDEPTVGMDARARRRTWEYIASLREQSKTVILTTHYIEEAQALSDLFMKKSNNDRRNRLVETFLTCAKRGFNEAHIFRLRFSNNCSLYCRKDKKLNISL